MMIGSTEFRKIDGQFITIGPRYDWYLPEIGLERVDSMLVGELADG